MFDEMTPAATLPVMRRTVLSHASQLCRHPATHQLPVGGRALGHSCACALARDRYSYSLLDVAAFPLLLLLLLLLLLPLLLQLLERACVSMRATAVRCRPVSVQEGGQEVLQWGSGGYHQLTEKPPQVPLKFPPVSQPHKELLRSRPAKEKKKKKKKIHREMSGCTHEGQFYIGTHSIDSPWFVIFRTSGFFARSIRHDASSSSGR